MLQVRLWRDAQLIRERDHKRRLRGTLRVEYAQRLDEELAEIENEIQRRGIGDFDLRRVGGPAEPPLFSEWTDLNLRLRLRDLMGEVERYATTAHVAPTAARQQTARWDEIERIKEELAARGFSA